MVDVFEIKNGELVLIDKRLSPKASVPKWKSISEKKELSFSKMTITSRGAGGDMILRKQNAPMQRYVREGNKITTSYQSRTATALDVCSTLNV